eukprot:364557-Chlamydomonas_euryale.AAC.40
MLRVERGVDIWPAIALDREREELGLGVVPFVFVPHNVLRAAGRRGMFGRSATRPAWHAVAHAGHTPGHGLTASTTRRLLVRVIACFPFPPSEVIYPGKKSRPSAGCSCRNLLSSEQKRYMADCVEASAARGTCLQRKE